MNHETRKIILAHYAAYPQSEIKDFIKLLFQNEFGGGHLISDRVKCLERITAEASQTLVNDIDIQDIGNGFARLHLGKNPSISNRLIGEIFLLSAKKQQGTVEGLQSKLLLLSELTKETLLPFSLEEVTEIVDDYVKAGCPMTSHSEKYRSAYAPAYRVVRQEFADFLPLYAKIEALFGQKDSVLLTIEGGSASGKSSLSHNLSLLFEASVIPMDDFFLQSHQRSPQRFATVGGNIDYERFNIEVAEKIQQKQLFSYQKFDCSCMKLTDRVEVPLRKIIIVEGVYSNHPQISLDPDCKVFLDIDHVTQWERLTQRNSPEMIKRFLDDWIPMENNYFKTYHIKEKADLVFQVAR